MSQQQPFDPIEPRPIGIGSRVLFGHYPAEPAVVTKVIEWPPGVFTYRVQIHETKGGHVGGEFHKNPVIEWLWTRRHAVWVGAEPEPAAPHVPDMTAKCFGPPLCEVCAEDLEALRSGKW